MKKKVLFIDYTYQKGHVNFNRIHIDAIKAAGYDVDIILHSDIASCLDYPMDSYVLMLPRFLNQRKNSPILNRVIYTIALLWIKIKVFNFSRYAHVVVSCCDEPTLWLMPLCRNMYIMCHNTASVNSRFKRFFLKRLSRHNTFLVFDEYMKQPLVENGIKNVKIVAHGCVPPFPPVSDAKLPVEAKGFRKLIFHPSSKADLSFVKELVNNAILCGYLKENKILLLIHGKKDEKWIVPDNIRFITGFLPIDVYHAIFLKSDAILLVYPSSFQYQVSGVSFECIANRKNIIVRHHPALTYCRDFYNYDPIFMDNCELLNKIKAVTADDTECRCVVSAETMIPDYNKIFE